MGVDKIWVLVERADGKVPPAALELLTRARDLATTVEAVAWGPDVAAVAAELGAYGAAAVLDAGDPGDALVGAPVAGAIAAAVAQGNGPDAVLIAATYDGRDIAGRLSARLDRPVITNVVGLEADGDGLLSEHGIFGGTQVATARFTGAGPALFVVRPKSFSAEPGGGLEGAPQVRPLPSGDLGSTNTAAIVAHHAEERTGPKLDEADVVVSGGRGLGSADAYAMIDELAKLLGGAPGASRAIVDAGWVPYAYQVGQTGKTVKPTVYLACGISGATQHMVGMKNSKNIIAVNKDQDAPIFTVADLGIVGDVHKVLPKLIEALKARS